MAPIALVDLDNTLADYHGAVARDMAAMGSPNEPPWDPGNETEWQTHRRHMIVRQPRWWERLLPLANGFRVLGLLKSHGFSVNILSKGPGHHPEAWAEKVTWCQRLVPNTPIILSDNKSLVYGRVIFDDWENYARPWLLHRPRGLWILPDAPWNRNVEENDQILRVDDNTPDDVISERLIAVRG